MTTCSHNVTPIQKGKIISGVQCPQNDKEKSIIKGVSHASFIRSLIDA